MKKTSGFTLIELLVVISIIALLMSMLMPALARVRQQAKAVVCQAQLKQWATVIQMYAEENREYLWEYKDWHLCWEPYYVDSKMLFCPMAKNTVDDGGRGSFMAWSDQGTYGSYGVNYYTPTLSKEDQQGANDRILAELWQTANYKGAARIPIIGDCGNYGAMPELADDPPEYDGDFFTKGEGSNIDEIQRFAINRHNGSVNMVFMDYSARKVGLKGLWKLWWGKCWRDNMPLEPDWPDWMASIGDDY